MGARINYCISKTNKTILENFYTDFDAFRRSIFASIEAYGELPLSIETTEHIFNLLTAKTCDKYAFSDDELDEVVAIYLEVIYNSGLDEIRYIHTGSCINKWKYKNSTWLVNTRCDELTKQRWNYLVHGRSVSNDICPSKAITKEELYGYWKPEELKPFLDALKAEFGTKQEFMDFYYTKERMDKLFTYECAGLECVYDILEEGILANREVVFCIEM